MTLNIEQVFINGPINAFRIEGTVDNIKKVLYIYGDIHLYANDQTQCDSIKSIEMKDYLMRGFNKSDKTIDFFLEIQPSYINTIKHKYRHHYILTLRYFFMKCFNFDIKKNKIYTSTVLPNVRFHYMDIRPLIEINPDIFKDMLLFYIKYNFEISDESVDNMLNAIKKKSDNTNFILDSLFDYSKKKEKYYNENMYSHDYTFDEKTALDIIKKTYDADNINVKNILKKIINTNIRPKILKYLSCIKELITLFPEYKQSMKSFLFDIDSMSKLTILKIKIYKCLKFCEFYDLYVGTLLTDMYFLRRMLDKQYITNSLIYCGNSHAINYIYTLIKYFDFKLTHFSYSNLSSDELTNIIKKTEDDFDIYSLYKYFGISYIQPYQCSDVTSFPDDFS